MKLWSPDEPVEKVVEQFTAQEDIELDEQLARYDILASIAHAYMLKHIGILSAVEFKKIKETLVRLLDEEIHLSPEDEDIHTKIENLLTERAGEAGEKIHTGRSRNDQILVDTRLYTKERLIGTAQNTLKLADRLWAFAKRHEFVPMPGYTHTRMAMPSSVGLWAAAFVESLLDDLKLLERVFELNDQSPLGAAAGYGVPLNLDRELTAKLLGFKSVQNNTLYVVSSRGKIESAVLSALVSITLDLSRLANDLILFSADEFGFFKLPKEFCTGSSIMPHKQNPDVLELVRAKSASVISDLLQVTLIIKDLPSGYNRDTQETKAPLLKSLETTNACLNVLSALVEKLAANEKRLREAFSAEIFAADEVLTLVEKGLPLRQAYRKVKRSLASLKKKDPIEAIRCRAHMGAPGNLGLSKLKKTIEHWREEWEREQRDFSCKLEALKLLN